MNDSQSPAQLPATAARFWVQCEDSWYVAVVDKDGKWKSFSNGRELPPVLSFVSIK